jgi:hypothetical protein
VKVVPKKAQKRLLAHCRRGHLIYFAGPHRRVYTQRGCEPVVLLPFTTGLLVLQKVYDMAARAIMRISVAHKQIRAPHALMGNVRRQTLQPLTAATGGTGLARCCLRDRVPLKAATTGLSPLPWTGAIKKSGFCPSRFLCFREVLGP